MGMLSSDVQSRRLRRLEETIHPRGELATGMFLQLCALRGFWPCSVHEAAGNALVGVGALGFDLSLVHSPQLGFTGMAPWVELATTDHATHADDAQFDIIGTETMVHADYRGLTFGGWYYWNSLDGIQGLFSKWNQIAVGPSVSYHLYKDALHYPIAEISSLGAGATTTVTSTVVASVGEWSFIAADFDPARSLSIFVDGVWTTQATADAALFDSTAPLHLGRTVIAATNRYLQGRASMQFICAADLGYSLVQALYEQTRTMFGR